MSSFRIVKFVALVTLVALCLGVLNPIGMKDVS